MMTESDKQARPLVLYVHRYTKKYYDYGSYLGSDEGVAFSYTGEEEDACGHTLADTVASWIGDDATSPVREAVSSGALVVRIGPAVSRSTDMNPHGLI